MLNLPKYCRICGKECIKGVYERAGETLYDEKTGKPYHRKFEVWGCPDHIADYFHTDHAHVLWRTEKVWEGDGNNA